MTPGLTITPQGCQATPFGSEAVTVQCSFTMTNTGTDALVIGVVAVDSAGNIVSMQPYQILPGAAPVRIGSPPVGGTWLVAAQTQGEINAAQDWSWFWAIIIGGLAGWTVGGLVVWAIRAATKGRY